MSIYERLMATRKGARALSAGRLRYEILKALHAALEQAGVTQAELSKRLGIRRSAVNQVFNGDGNVRINTLAEYLHELGTELDIQLVPLGTQRAAAVKEIQEHAQAAVEVRNYPVGVRSPRRSLAEISWMGDTDSHTIVPVTHRPATLTPALASRS
jgi:transcriptional regulator with XRE-family HTH domain